MVSSAALDGSGMFLKVTRRLVQNKREPQPETKNRFPFSAAFTGARSSRPALEVRAAVYEQDYCFSLASTT